MSFEHKPVLGGLRLCAYLGFVLLLAACARGWPGGIEAKTGELPGEIRVLSNRADLLSGDDALVEIVAPAADAALIVELNGKDVSGQFARRDNGRVLGLLQGLALGENRLVARNAQGEIASTTLVNHPNGGPVFSGPQVQPWSCQSTALDAQCNQPAEYSYLYKARNKADLQPYDPANPPDDIETTTTQQGQTLPFIVRQELGYQDRDQYKILQLFQPDQPWEPWAPQSQWNHKLLITGGGGCGSAHAAGGAPLDDFSGTFSDVPLLGNSYVYALGQGYAVGSTALDNLGHNCNVAVMAESLMMMKERLIEQYGELRYTIGTGCSGGSIMQNWVANAYPGIFQGLLTTCSYPDVWSPVAQYTDYHLLRKYFEAPQRWAPGVVWTPEHWALVEGHVSHVNAIVADNAFVLPIIDPSSDCSGVPVDIRYDQASKPDGVRCGLFDYVVNLMGLRAPEVWSPNEQQLGRSFAGSVVDNVGIQYGLTLLQRGLITPDMFIDLNAKIGGFDIDFKTREARTVGDTQALGNSYRSGVMNVTNNLNSVAIINSAGPDPGAAHDTVHAWWTRWRLDREHGTHDNHVMYTGPVALIGDVRGPFRTLDDMDRWLAAVEKDSSDTPLPQKIVRNKPADIADQCTDGVGQKIADGICPEVLMTIYSTPRDVAGDHRTADTLKCQLKPIVRGSFDYGPLPFTDAQWAQLQAIFPEGVCDYSKPAIGAQPTVPWLAYGDARTPVYGGTPLPAAPVGIAAGWVSPAFSPPR